ncbi:MAG: LamG domain-containing protein [Actinomycetota bacterium]
MRYALRALVTIASLVVMTLPATATASTVGLWHMDETSGTTMNDASAFDNDGSLEHVSFSASGWSGRAYSFNGSSSLVVIPNDASLNPGTRDITLSAYIKVTQAPSRDEFDYDIVRKKAQGSIYKMEVLYTGTGYCQFKGTKANGVVKGGPVVTDGTWHHLECLRTANRVRLLVDGVEVKAKSVATGSISNKAALVLGGKPDRSDDWFRGLMDEVSVIFGS